jgi:uncharacterized repeat protein (TIGR03803 family)
MNGVTGSLLAGAVVCGLLLQVPAAQAGREKVLYNFCSQQDCTDGGNPSSGLTEVNGVLYGMTRSGGAGLCFGGTPACGTVFALDPQTGSETVLHSFTDPDTDGIFPSGGVIAVKGKLYGTTTDGGGSNGGGTVFTLDPQTGAESLLHSFFGGSDGYVPEGWLISVKGTLYGTTMSGGSDGCFGYGCGTVFAVNRKTGAETVLHAFISGADGAFPSAGLVAVNGTLYGTTTQGGGNVSCSNGCGTVFAINPKTGAETVVYAFTGGSDGSDPAAGLINVKGTLYGTTAAGGAHAAGTVFALDPQTGAHTVLYSFCSQQNCTDGQGPDAGLTNVNGTLYGTTPQGGANTFGTVFALDLGSNAEKVLYSFGSQPNSTDGQIPRGGVIANGKWLYGMTYLGGSGTAGSGGVVFAVKR